MFKKDRIAFGVYRDKNEIKVKELRLKNVTKKEAKDRMWDYLCWKKGGLKLSFRNVEHVFVRSVD